jgi:uncharacterized protein
MNAQTERTHIAGEAGQIEVLIDRPASSSVGHAVVAHPHPLFGGTMDNKVVQTLARALVQNGWTCIRFNFRGVGASQGEHDHGLGEARDLLTLIEQLAPQGPLALAGFSFGAFVTTHAIAALHPAREIRQVVLVGTAAARFDVAPIPADLHDRTLVIHGEADDTVPLASAMDWARPQGLPILVVPGGGHFFHGQLPQLKNWVARHLRA